jgi:uncharacterized damage-inducible protein DinB
MKVWALTAGLVWGVCSVAGSAQMAGMPEMAKPAVGSSVAPARALDDMLSLFEGELTGVAKAMPADKYSFAPSAAIFAPNEGAKFDTVRTFGGQLTHIIQANYYFYSSVSGLKPDADMKTIGTLTKKDDILAALAASFAYAHKAIATVTPENAFLAIKPVDGQSTRATLAAFAVAHGFDHYGQMVEYLRMNGIVPPGSK